MSGPLSIVARLARRGPIYHYHSSILRQHARARRGNVSSVAQTSDARHSLKRRLANTSTTSDRKCAYANDDLSESPEIKGRKMQVANGPISDGGDVFPRSTAERKHNYIPSSRAPASGERSSLDTATFAVFATRPESPIFALVSPLLLGNFASLNMKAERSICSTREP